ncbi:MAG TPA: asparagine synthase (glutamine-hydrolyzing) [Methylomirabilota bacterium]|nr:asparagine synthase (glutamine-hydrolyzing) [Methylomirabilota bacterium]
MCGIAGFVSTDPGADLGAALKGMLQGLVHRGPDDEGTFLGPGVGLGMRRLSVVDLAGSQQPIANEDQSVHVVCNGEIYNYVELRAGLEQRGHRLRTRGDVEVLVHLYEDHGPEMLSRLRGMFAFALWDANRQRLFMARDRLGKKPLYYALGHGRLFFSSEIAPLIDTGVVSRDVDAEALASYLLAGYVPAPLCLFKQVRKLPPAHCLSWQAGRTECRRYWHLNFLPKISCSHAEAVSRVREKLDESIRLRLRSDVPLGLLLSGGLDSNAILARLTRGLDHPIRTFTIGFGEKDYDETALARESARHFGVPYDELTARSNLLELLPRLVVHYGEPFADKSALPSFLVCELARQHVKVALSGDGGDEAFAGYGKYRLNTWQLHSSSCFPRSWRESWSLGSLRGDGLVGSRISRNLRRQWLPETRSLFTNEFFAGHHFRRLGSPELRQSAEALLADQVASFWDRPLEPIDRMLAWDNRHYLPDDLLVKMDIASMAHGLEVRSPFLDHELVELCASLPAAWKVDHRQGKRLLRIIVEPDLPPALRQAPKTGFSVPIEDWFRGEARKHIRDGLGTLHAGLRTAISQPYVHQLLEEHQNGVRNHAQRLWCLWVLNAWAERFLRP